MGIPQWLTGMLKEGRFRSVYHLAHELNVPQPTVHRWLKGQARPSLPHCIRLAKVTDTPIETVVLMAGVDGEDAREPSAIE